VHVWGFENGENGWFWLEGDGEGLGMGRGEGEIFLVMWKKRTKFELK